MLQSFSSQLLQKIKIAEHLKPSPFWLILKLHHAVRHLDLVREGSTVVPPVTWAFTTSALVHHSLEKETMHRPFFMKKQWVYNLVVKILVHLLLDLVRAASTVVGSCLLSHERSSPQRHCLEKQTMHRPFFMKHYEHIVLQRIIHNCVLNRQYACK